MIIDDKVYGKRNIADKLVIDLVNTPEMKRLKGVNQYGTWGIWDKKYDTSRFEHSVGVYLLLQRLGAGRLEQIAGLLHDINHSAFSHVIDYVHGDPTVQEHGDNNHERIIRKSKIPGILRAHNLDIEQILRKQDFQILENQLPDVCADRFDYCLRDSLLFGTAGKDDITALLNSVIVYDHEMVMADKASAQRFADIYLATSRQFWVNPVQTGIFQLAANSFKKALREKTISEDDLYMTDSEVLEKLRKAMDPDIMINFAIIKDHAIAAGTRWNHDFKAYGKARYIDPRYLNGSGMQRLSESDKNYRKEIEQFKKEIDRGFYIRILP
jgi:uncharacterized protein